MIASARAWRARRAGTRSAGAQDQDATHRDARLVPRASRSTRASAANNSRSVRPSDPSSSASRTSSSKASSVDRLLERDEHAPVGDGHQLDAGQRGQAPRRRDEDHRAAAEGRRRRRPRARPPVFCASASRTMARPRSASTALSRSITSSGNVRVTVRAGRLNLRGRPRRTSRMGIFYSVMHPHARTPHAPTPPHPHTPCTLIGPAFISGVLMRRLMCVIPVLVLLAACGGDSNPAGPSNTTDSAAAVHRHGFAGRHRRRSRDRQA